MSRLLNFAVSLCLWLGCVQSLPAMSTINSSPDYRNHTSTNKEVAAIEEQINTLFAAVDARDWPLATRLFADSVKMDYSDLGAEAATLSSEQIITGWQAMLPGFELTLHQPHNYAVWVAGDRASATYDAIALHFLDDRHWVVFAGYDTEFERREGAWKIVRMRLSLYDQNGDLSLPQLATARVEAGTNPAPLAVQNENTQRVSAQLATLSEGDVDGYLSYFAERGTQRMPLAPAGFPTERSGMTELRGQYAPVSKFVSQVYPAEVFGTSNSNIVVAKYRGEIQVTDSTSYNNSYLGVWEFDDSGKIWIFTEYFNPRILVNGFPGITPAHYSVHVAGASPASGVKLQEVHFEANGNKLVGHLFLPPGFEESKTYPAVVVTGSWTSVKEQMPDVYASRLAEDGFVTLTFDFRGFGESEGEPRQFEDYERKIADIRSAITYLSNQPNVADGITGLGICASAGYMAHATAQDHRIRRLAFIAPWLHTPAMTQELYATRPGGRDALFSLGEQAREHYTRTGEVHYDQAVSEVNPLAAMYVPEKIFPYYLDPALGAGPHYVNRWATMSWEPWLSFDAHMAAEEITVPVHIVHSEQGAVPEGARAFINRLPARPKAVWLNDYTQMDLYYKPEAVTAAIDTTSIWLRAQISE